MLLWNDESANSDPAFDSRFVAEFDRSFGAYADSERLDRLPTPDLHRIFEAASLAASSGHGPALATMRDCLDVLEARGQAEDAQRESLYGMLLMHRAFEEAAALRRAHGTPAMEAIPPVVGLDDPRLGMPTVLVPDSREFLLRRSRVDLRLGIEWVAVWQPGCQFAQRALGDIRRNPQLANALLGRAHWVAPATGQLDFDRLQAWNAANPDVAVSMLYRGDEWPAGMTLDATPVFHVFVDGVLAEKVEGWRGAESEEELLSLLVRTGALAQEGGE